MLVDDAATIHRRTRLVVDEMISNAESLVREIHHKDIRLAQKKDELDDLENQLLISSQRVRELTDMVKALAADNSNLRQELVAATNRIQYLQAY